MPSLPIPLVSSLVLGFLLIRMWFLDRRHGPLAMLLAMCAAQGLIISMAQHYLVPGMRLIQPVTATLIPPMAWIAFQTTAVRRYQTTDLLHLAGPFCAVVCLLVRPVLLDTLIPALFCGYGIAILWQNLKGADALPRLRLEAGDLPGLIWRIMGLSLIASAFTDVLIVVAQSAGAAYLQPWIISVYSSIMLLVIGILSLSNALVHEDAKQEDAPVQQVSDLDAQIFARLETLMQEQKLYLNSDLTLSQLSRKLVVPVKQLSGAINRVTGENVSRYINTARIKAAQQALLSGENVTSAMLSSGFNTKSNFNREFLRVSKASPSDWITANRDRVEP